MSEEELTRQAPETPAPNTDSPAPNTSAPAPNTSAPAPEASAAPAAPHHRQKPVYVYIFVLFVVALLLMALSLFMAHRNNQQVIGELQSSANSMQLLQESEERNVALGNRIDELEGTVAAQKETIAAQQQKILELERQLAPLLAAAETPAG